MSDADAADEWLDSWAARANAQAARAADLSRRVSTLTSSAESLDGAIRVTVGSAGQIQTLDLDDRIHDLAAPDLAQEILAAMREAQAGLAAKVATEVRDTVGTDSETGRAVIASFTTRFPSEDESPM
ncbi:YbaB/EbfC family nucleoid-associated protein [Actinoplanes sp. NPDC051861]|uniref:YbaB/EbfC family nucleoid-associated protein n=1 Tax=Actinoplanes sp. NPDC051861 TaxID=3155170 RepID=UPI0034184AA9